jgi:hypothetical protein
MSDLQIFLNLSGIVLTTLVAGYVCFSTKPQTHTTVDKSAVLDYRIDRKE